MSKSTVPLVSLALALAAGSAYLLGQLRTEHARAVVLQTRVAELQRPDAVSPAEEPSPPREPRVADTSAGVSQEPVEAPATSQTKPVPTNKCASPDSAELARQLADRRFV